MPSGRGRRIQKITRGDSMQAGNWLWLSIAAGLLAVIYGVISMLSILKLPAGNARMQEIAAAIQAGAKAYLNRQYATITVVGIVLFVALGFALNWQTAGGFAIGAILSGLAVYIGMTSLVRGTLRIAQVAHSGRDAVGRGVFRGGGVSGLLVGGLGVLGVARYYLFLDGASGDAEVRENALHALVGLAF